MKFYKDFFKRVYIPNKKLDKYVYVSLILFLILVVILKTNYIATCCLAIGFMIIFLLLFILQTKILKIFSKEQKKYMKIIENITNEELENVIIKYYISKNYKIVNIGEKLQIMKNDNIYDVLIIKNSFDKNKIKPNKKVSGTIIVTNTEITKEDRKFIKKNKIYSITKQGLVNILKEQKIRGVNNNE